MATIEIILRDDDGNIINQKTPKSYPCKFDKKQITEIENEVEEFKRQSLPDITHDFLAHAQQKQTDSIKKKSK